jgi:hypothetical protein
VAKLNRLPGIVVHPVQTDRSGSCAAAGVFAGGAFGHPLIFFSG